MKYKFIIKKTQYAFVLREFDSQCTLESALDSISNMGEEEIEFGNPEYNLEAISNEIEKVSKIIWTRPTRF